MKIHISSVALFKRGIYFERNSGDRAEVCGLALCMLDVLLALMAAGLAEGRTEKGARGGGGPERLREEAPAYPAPTPRQTNRNHTDCRSSQSRSGGRADGRSGRAVFVYELPGGFTVNGS